VLRLKKQCFPEAYLLSSIYIQSMRALNPICLLGQEDEGKGEQAMPMCDVHLDS
jgi:hypothetical protein